MKDTKSNANLIASVSASQEWVLIGPVGPGPALLPRDLPVLAVDGGARNLSRMDLWVGDGDSLGGLPTGTPALQFPVEKAASDLALALGLFKDRSQLKLHLWGFLGARRDHELFNLGEVLTFLETQRCTQVWLYASGDTVAFKAFSPGAWEFEHQGIFSLGTLREASVTLQGECRYHLCDEILEPLSSRGLSNVATGTVRLQALSATFLYFPEAM